MKIGLCLVLGIHVAVLAATPDDSRVHAWNRFRGPNGSGVSRTAEIPVDWSNRHQLWKTQLSGTGHASPVLWGGRLFVISADESSGARHVTCLAAADGSELWTRTFSDKAHTTHQLNSLASATPAVDEDHVYVTWATPEQITLLALTHDGEEVWRTEPGPYTSGHGFGQSPILYRDLVILPVEKGEDSYRLALHRSDGSIVWKAPCKSSLHYATPCVRSTADGDELIFVNWEQGVCGVDPDNGTVRWQADVFDKEHIESSIGSPVLAGRLVIGVAGWLGHGYEAVAVDPERPGDKLVWKLNRGAPLCTTPLVVDDLVIFWADNGIVTCVDAETGRVHWRERLGGNFYASPVCAGRTVYNISAEGEMVVLAADREYQLLGRYPLGEASHATPAIVGNRMYVRTLSHVLCFGSE